MAREPYSPVPDTAFAGPAREYQNIPASPQDFGGLIGQAEQRTGGEVEQDAARIGQVAVQRQDWLNQVSTDDAFNKFQKGLFNLTYGDPNNPSKPGFYGLKGQDAMSAFTPTVNSMDQLRDQIKSSLPSAMAQVQFDTASRRLQMFTAGEMGRHYDNQAGQYALAVNKATEDTNLQAIYANPTDETNYQNALATAKSGAVRAAQTQWGLNADPSIIVNATNRVTSNAVVTRAMSWGERGNDPTSALRFLEANRDSVDPVKYDAVVNHLKGLATNAGVTAGIDEAMGRTPAGSARAPVIAVPSGAPTPWLENRSDSNVPGQGTTVSQYVGKVMNQYRANGGDMFDAIVNGGEQSGPTAVSPKGAAGQAQVTPGFFQQYAQPGENFNNEADRMAVARRGVAALSQKYGGDPQKVAVAYFSGENNVASGGGEAPVAASNRPYVIGDSIGAGVRLAGRLEGNVETGAAPDAILHGINGLSQDAVKGRDIVLSSGASNNPQQVGLLDDQIKALKAKGAANITVLGVGTRQDLAGVNDQLARIAQQNGVTFAGPLANVGPDQIHPVNYGPLAQSVTQASLPTSGAQPHNPIAYGAEAERMANARSIAQRLFPNDPEAQHKMVQGVWEEVQQTNVLQAKYEAEQAKALKDSQDKIMNDAITVLHADPTKFDPSVLNAKDAAGNYVLTAAQRDTMNAVVEKQLAEAGHPDIRGYGPGYTKVYNGIFAPEGDPNKISTPHDILQRAAPGGDLTLAGAEILTKVLGASQKSPDDAGIHTTAASLLNYAKRHLSFEDDTGIVKIADPKGEQIFNAQFVPKFEKSLSDWRAAGKDPWQFLTRENIDKMMEGMRSPTQMAQDRLAATGQLGPQEVEKPGTPIPPVPSPLDKVKDFPLRNAPGMVEPGNLDPWNRPVLHNPDGSYSTTSSISIGTDKGEVVIPTVVNGKRLSNDEAAAHYRQTGENFGTFKTPEAADDFATKLHNAQAGLYDEKGNPLPSLNKDEWASMMSAPPKAENGQTYTHAAWAEVLRRLAADPEHVIPWFDQRFGRGGYSGAELVQRLKAPERPELAPLPMGVAP